MTNFLSFAPFRVQLLNSKQFLPAYVELFALNGKVSMAHAVVHLKFILSTYTSMNSCLHKYCVYVCHSACLLSSWKSINFIILSMEA